MSNYVATVPVLPSGYCYLNSCALQSNDQFTLCEDISKRDSTHRSCQRFFGSHLEICCTMFIWTFTKAPPIKKLRVFDIKFGNSIKWENCYTYSTPQVFGPSVIRSFVLGQIVPLKGEFGDCGVRSFLLTWMVPHTKKPIRADINIMSVERPRHDRGG